MSTQCIDAQSKSQVDTWLYDLPVVKGPVSIRKAIVKSNYFESDKKSHSTKHKHSKSTFEGKIIAPALPIYGSVDSTQISLRIGTLHANEGYSGDMKWLFFEYFSSDTFFLNALYDTACLHLLPTSIEKKHTGHRTMHDEAIGDGFNFVYLSNTDQWRSISATRVRYASGRQSFMIIYAGSVD